MKRVFITGGAGWIGSFACLILRERGFEILPIHVKTLTERRHNLLFGEFYLLHLAWITTPNVYWESSDNIFWFKHSIRLLQDFHEAGGKRVVVAGTNVDTGGTLYGRCKGALRTILDAYRVTGLSTATGRIFYLYGPGEKPNRLISSIIIALLKGEEVTINHPSQMLDFLHVHDVASALCAILESNVEGAVDIGSGNVTTTMRIAQIIGEKIGRPELIKCSNIPSVDRIVCDTHRLKNEVGWERKFNLDSGLDDTIEWWRGHLNGT